MPYSDSETEELAPPNDVRAIFLSLGESVPSVREFPQFGRTMTAKLIGYWPARAEVNVLMGKDMVASAMTLFHSFPG